MKQERISVVVPAYNIAKWLPRCLDSLLAQTYENLDIIVVNDGSTDDTRAVLDAYAASHERVKVIHKENGGVTSARLRGVREAEGAWIGFIDGDDVAEPWMYAHLMENARTYGAEISHCGHQYCYPDGRVFQIHGTGLLRQQDHLTGLQDLLDGGQVDGSLCTKLFRRELFEGLEAWMDPSLKNNEDVIMNYYLFAKANSSVYEDICPYRYLLREGSASFRQFNVHTVMDPIRVRQIILRECEPELKEDAVRALLRRCLFSYGDLALRLDREYDGLRAQVRKLLRENRTHFGLMTARNQILANMICIAPWSFHLAFGLYAKLTRWGESY